MTDERTLSASGDGPADLDLWIVPHDVPARFVASFERWADADEAYRAARFFRDADRVAYIVSHAALRHVLGKCAGCDPAAIRYRFDVHGKPSLEYPADSRVRFNMSHTAGLTVIAVSRNVEIGADVESFARIAAASDIYDVIAAPEELPLVQSLGGDEAAYSLLWTVKEAALKLEGIGIIRRPATIAMEKVGENDYRVHQAAGTGPFPSAHVRSLIPAENFAAAVALRVPIADLRIHSLGPDDLPDT